MVVREIKGWTETTPIPKAPSARARGDQPARRDRADLRSARPLRHGPHRADADARGDHRDAGTRTIGLLVDAVSDIISVEPGAMPPVPDLDLADRRQFLEGLVALDDRMVTLVSLDGLFGNSAGVEAATAAAAATASLAAKQTRPRFQPFRNCKESYMPRVKTVRSARKPSAVQPARAAADNAALQRYGQRSVGGDQQGAGRHRVQPRRQGAYRQR